METKNIILKEKARKRFLFWQRLLLCQKRISVFAYTLSAAVRISTNRTLSPLRFARRAFAS